MVQSLPYEAFCLPFLLPLLTPLEAISSFPAVEFSFIGVINMSVFFPVICDPPPAFTIVESGRMGVKKVCLSLGPTINLLCDHGQGPL